MTQCVGRQLHILVEVLYPTCNTQLHAGYSYLYRNNMAPALVPAGSHQHSILNYNCDVLFWKLHSIRHISNNIKPTVNGLFVFWILFDQLCQISHYHGNLSMRPIPCDVNVALATSKLPGLLILYCNIRRYLLHTLSTLDMTSTWNNWDEGQIRRTLPPLLRPCPISGCASFTKSNRSTWLSPRRIS